MIRSLGPAARQGAYKVPGGPLTADNFRKAVGASGFAGHVIVGSDLASLRLPAR